MTKTFLIIASSLIFTGCSYHVITKDQINEAVQRCVSDKGISAIVIDPLGGKWAGCMNGKEERL